MQRCQQQIARIVAASDGVETELPMLSRMGQLPPGAHMRLTGANLRLASSLSALTEPNGRKRAWQPFAEGEELPHTATWLDGSAANLWQSGSKFTKPDDWLPAAPEMQQSDLSVALGELAGTRAPLLPPPLPPAMQHSTHP